MRRLPKIENASPFKIDGACCRLVPLTRGFYAIVDAEDYERVSGKVWQVQKIKHNFYATNGGGSDHRGGRYEKFLMHRFILHLKVGDKVKVDHRNRITLDNRKANLRIATNSQNGANAGRKSHNKSGFKGVCFEKFTQRWKACIRVNGKSISVGRFRTKEQASDAYMESAKKHFGEFASK